MTTLKRIEKILQIHEVIKKEQTGSSSELSVRLNISQRTVQNYIDELRMFGATILYDRNRNTYYYTNDFSIEFHLKIDVGADFNKNK